MRKAAAALLVVMLMAPLPLLAGRPDWAPDWLAAPVLGIPGSMAMLYLLLVGVLVGVAIDRGGSEP
jgi:hypothetical protein